MSLDITSGLYSQIQQLKKRLKALDAAEANPSDITEVSKALEALEARYDKQKESKRLRMEDRKKKEADEFNSQVLQMMGGDAPSPTSTVEAAGCDQCSASMINGVFCHETGCPKAKEDRVRQQNDDLYDMEMNDMDAAKTTKADTNILALDTRVEPTRGTPGSYGRVMRHDAGSDTVYVMWDGGKLKESHGFGAYSLADLKIHSAEEKKVPHNAGPEHYCPECTPSKTAEPMAEPTPEDVQNMPNAQNPVAPQGPKGNPEKRYQQIKKIVDESQYGKVEGQMVDGFTASLLLQIADQLNPENRLKFLSLPMGRMVDVAWKLANKTAEKDPAVIKEAAQFGSHGNGKGLNDLYVLPSTPEEGQKIVDFLKSANKMFEWSNANVQGHEWYGKRFIEIPFGESLQPEIEKLVGATAVAFKIFDITKTAVDEHRPGVGIEPCNFCGSKECDYSCDESQASQADENVLWSGYPNKETWATKLWIDNDTQWFSLARGLASKARNAEELAELLKNDLNKDVMDEMARRYDEKLSHEKVDWKTIAEILYDEVQSANETTPLPEPEKDLLDDSPVMDKYKIRDTIDKLLEQLHAETDPAKKEQIKQRIKSLKSAGRHPKLNKKASSDEDIIAIMVSEGWGADSAKTEVASWRKGDNITPGALASINQAIKQLQKTTAVKSNEPSGIGYGGDRPGVNVAPMRDEDTSLAASKASKITVFAKELTVHTHTDKIAYDVFDGDKKVLTITPKEKLTQEQVEVIVAQEYAKNNVVKAKVTKDLTVLKKGHLVRILALDEKKLHVKFASLESPELTGWAPFTKFQLEANWPSCSVDGCTNKADSVGTDDSKRYCYTHSWGQGQKMKEAHDILDVNQDKSMCWKCGKNPLLNGYEFCKPCLEQMTDKRAHANPGECPTCRRSRDMKDSGDGKSKCSYCGTVSETKDLDGNNGGKRPWDKKADNAGLNGYLCYWRGKQFEVWAKTSFEAQKKCALEHGIKKSHEITVVLAEKAGGEPVVHKPQDVLGKKADLQEMKHGDHVDQVLGDRDSEVLVFCGNKVVWLPKGDMTSTTPPPATPEALNPDVASAEAPVEKEAGPLCANCAVRFNTMEEYAKHKQEAHKPSDPAKTQQIKERVEKRLAPHLVSKRLGKKDPKYNYDEEMENAEELPEDAEASKTLPAVEKSADDVNTPPQTQAPQGMKWSWDADKRRWFLVKQQGMV